MHWIETFPNSADIQGDFLANLKLNRRARHTFA
jgi:hypothetical protein